MNEELFNMVIELCMLEAPTPEQVQIINECIVNVKFFQTLIMHLISCSQPQNWKIFYSLLFRALSRNVQIDFSKKQELVGWILSGVPNNNYLIPAIEILFEFDDEHYIIFFEEFLDSMTCDLLGITKIKLCLILLKNNSTLQKNEKIVQKFLNKCANISLETRDRNFMLEFMKFVKISRRFNFFLSPEKSLSISHLSDSVSLREPLLATSLIFKALHLEESGYPSDALISQLFSALNEHPQIKADILKAIWIVRRIIPIEEEVLLTLVNASGIDETDFEESPAEFYADVYSGRDIKRDPIRMLWYLGSKNREVLEWILQLEPNEITMRIVSKLAKLYIGQFNDQLSEWVSSALTVETESGIMLATQLYLVRRCISIIDHETITLIISTVIDSGIESSVVHMNLIKLIKSLANICPEEIRLSEEFSLHIMEYLNAASSEIELAQLAVNALSTLFEKGIASSDIATAVIELYEEQFVNSVTEEDFDVIEEIIEKLIRVLQLVPDYTVNDEAIDALFVIFDNNYIEEMEDILPDLILCFTLHSQQSPLIVARSLAMLQENIIEISNPYNIILSVLVQMHNSIEKLFNLIELRNVIEMFNFFIENFECDSRIITADAVCYLIQAGLCGLDAFQNAQKLLSESEYASDNLSCALIQASFAWANHTPLEHYAEHILTEFANKGWIVRPEDQELTQFVLQLESEIEVASDENIPLSLTSIKPHFVPTPFVKDQQQYSQK